MYSKNTYKWEITPKRVIWLTGSGIETQSFFTLAFGSQPSVRHWG
ncbi:hypothetical protein [Dyadobacter sp. 3J3]|nr:hypothetical protein [Dyadobacter sp. 3J3]